MLYERPADDRARRQLQRQLDDCVTRCVRHGIRLLLAPPAFLARDAVRGAHRNAGADRYLFTVRCDDEIAAFGLPPLPALVIHPFDREGDSAPAFYYSAAIDLPGRILVLPSDLRDPERPTSVISDLRFPNVSLSRFLASL